MPAPVVNVVEPWVAVKPGMAAYPTWCAAATGAPGPAGGEEIGGVRPGGYLDLPVHGHLLDGALRHGRLGGSEEAAKRGEQRHREHDASSGGGEPAAAAAEQAAQPDQGEHRF